MKRVCCGNCRPSPTTGYKVEPARAGYCSSVTTKSPLSPVWLQHNPLDCGQAAEGVSVKCECQIDCPIHRCRKCHPKIQHQNGDIDWNISSAMNARNDDERSDQSDSGWEERSQNSVNKVLQI